MKTLSTLVFCWISLAVFIPVGNAQYSFQQAVHNQWLSVQNQQNVHAANANAFRNGKMLELQRAREQALRNQAIIRQRGFEKRQREYLDRLEKHRENLADEFRKQLASDSFVLSDSQMAAIELIAGIATIAWAEKLEGKSNGFFYGAICPAFMDHFGTELLKDSLERAGLNKDASGPLSLVASAGVKFLFSGKDFNRGISSIGDRTPSEFISSELNKVDPNLSELQIGLRQLDELHTRLLEANGKSRLKK